MLWEYTVDVLPCDSGIFSTGKPDPQTLMQRLNAFGGQGWQLVSSYATTYPNGGSHMLIFIYSRPKTSPEVPPVVDRP